MTIKVVFNARHGGFSISQSCALYMAERGNEEAQKMLNEFFDPDDPYWYGNWEGARHDPLLVEAVEKLGHLAGEAWGDKYPQHGVYELLQGTKYIIREYDGLEVVIEPEDISWIEVIK